MMNRRGKNGAEDPKVKVTSLIRRGNDLAAACRRDRAELVQDLNDRNGGKTPLDPGLGAEALERSRKLSRMDIQTTLNGEASKDYRYRRNALYNRMYSLIKTICACGRQVFNDDPRKRNYFCGNPRTG